VAPPVDFLELGIPSGVLGKIISISEIPDIEAGAGRVVLTTVSHAASDIYRLLLRSGDEAFDTLNVTGSHRFFSETRGWVHANQLLQGEVLRGRDGPVRVANVKWVPKLEQVYNFTVEADHVYYVGDFSTLTHNTCTPVTVAGVHLVPYKKGEGHHPFAKSAFDGVSGYGMDGVGELSIPNPILQNLGIRHTRLTGIQHSLYAEFRATGKPITLEVMKKIETETMIRAGGDSVRVTKVVNFVYRDLVKRGIHPIRIPWDI
jgi:hypothetical protein